MIVRRIFVAGMLWAGLSCHALLAQNPAPQESTVLQPGDAVRITVWRQDELSGEFMIAANGAITHPLYRTVVVANVPLEEARQRIEQFLREFETDPQFVILPLLRVSVGGEVRQPNLYQLTPETTVAQAVAMAGGATDGGQNARVRLLRSGEITIGDLHDPAGELAQTRVRSGDQVFVERRRSVFRDYFLPAVGVAGSLASILNILLR